MWPGPTKKNEFSLPRMTCCQLEMPFKILDHGTVLTYEGLKFSNVVDTVHTIKTPYEPKKHQNHSTKDEWWYYFDKNNGAFVTSMVYHEPIYPLIENLSVIESEDLTFPGRRKSYRCNKFGEEIFLRAEFWYADYSVKFLHEL